MAKVNIRPDDRVLFVGQTGTGKSYLARQLLAPVVRLIVVDTKGSVGADDWGLDRMSNTQLRRLRNGRAARVLARWDGTESGDDWLNDILYYGFVLGDLTIYVDEVYPFMSMRPSNEVLQVWTQGRERGVGAWAATQRPSFIPLVILSEATHIFQFRLLLDSDRKKLQSFVGDSAIQSIKDAHGFNYANIGGESSYWPEYSNGGKRK